MTKNHHKRVTHVYIPFEILQDEKLTATAKTLYGELTRIVDERGLCEITKNQITERLTLTKETVTRALNQLKENNYIKEYDTVNIVDLLKTKNMKELGVGDRICSWCKVKTYVLHKHHYPVRKEHGGTETIKICPNCHHEFHYHEKRVKLNLEQEQINYIIANRSQLNGK